ncbi:BTAD domain-containing putative transcriptional regulator [Umezawaea tangerina]|uniref:Transcriptional activator n=1 Tax=Umezawaea tangerina TaxID=84725 RepID=A0A2T0THG3_9PSEU|nr:BTAD domain-containing putative transcriptional regulator [Umezawaea tangerina]PRY45134.1 transcriptional activator [Umezawaea tangerina]
MDPTEAHPDHRTGVLPVRPVVLPRPLDVEVPRPRLVRSLAGRWDRPVTVVVAGPGFGKTTALAQAVRANLLEPRGVDVWVDCAAAHEDPVLLARTLLAALSTEDRVRAAPGARDVVGALVRLAPVDVCLVLDDVHEIPAGSPGARLLGAVVRALPATAHLVLSGLDLPDLPLARREAAGEVVRIGADDLLFTDVEVGVLGRRLGREPARAGAVTGWPALVRLAFAVGPAASWRYAREEVLEVLPAGQRTALAALSALGCADAAEVAAVAGLPVDLAGLARRVPLVTALDDGRYRVHDLWTEALTGTAARTPHLHRRAAAVLADRGDLARAGAVACRAQDWSLLAELAVELVNTTLSALPRALAERWLAAVPPALVSDPAFLLLRAAAAHATDFADPGIDAVLDLAWHGLTDRDTIAAVVLGQAVITAHSRADVGRLAELARRADDLPGAPTALVRLLRHSLAATLAEVGGDPEAALAEIVQAPVREVPSAVALATARFHHHCLDMCGFGREAAELADRVGADSDDELVRLAAPLARWFDGDPSGLALLRGAAPRTAGTARDAFVTAAFLAVVACCCGDARRPCGDQDDHDNPRDAALACAARAAVAVADGDESTAAKAYARHLDRWPVGDRFNERHLRRFLSLGHVLDDRLRACWDEAELGPSHRKARDAARALLRARADDLAPAARLPPEHALCFLPLPWSVELAARLTAAHDHAGPRLGRWLADAVGPAAHREFRTACRSTDSALATGAVRLLALLPTPPEHRTGVDVVGALRVRVDGVVVDAPQLRRVRVRQLLSALVLHPVLTRERAMDLLWPELAPAAAARNLRVTLTHLRHLLEPGRSGGEANFHLRADGDALRLVGSDRLSVDLWTFDLLDAQAARARADGDLDRARDLLAAAVALWRGDPLPDLRPLPDPDVAIEVDRIRARHVRHLLDLGELRLVAGDAGEAGRLAARALAVEPYDARGHRLALAAALKGRDPVRLAAVRDHVVAAFRQLGVRPDPATGLLLRQALSPRR